MKGRYAGVSMRTYGAILPGATRLARLPAEPSAEAKRRLDVIKWYEGHGRKVRLTARHFGFSPDTVSRWTRAYNEYGPSGLEKGSRRHHEGTRGVAEALARAGALPGGMSVERAA